ESTGDIWVADTGNHRVLRFPKGAGFTNGGTADKVIGQANFTSGSANQGGAVSALSLASPSGVAFDGSGNLWVVDKGNNRVLRFPKGGGFTDGMAADLVLGQADFVSGAPATTATRLKAPGGIAFDLSGNLWVGDSSLGGNNRVLRYSKPFSTGMAADLVLGQLTFTLNAANGGGTPDARTLFGSAVTAFDGSGNLLVREGSNYPGISEGNNRVLVFNPATTPPGPNPNPDCTPAVYPNPVHPSKGETSVTVTCVPAGASVRLYTVAGEEIKVVTADANGHATWNISNAMGTNVVTGVYYALILHEGHKHTVTLAVER
ncbi:MAG: NHL repeat-containing protein, partial [Elusimicrobia bacterium]|nr:NHL repeat-containing protein [Elusimicrobiota bacterium]